MKPQRVRLHIEVQPPYTSELNSIRASKTEEEFRRRQSPHALP
jgi:hypothetical protein